MSLRACFSTAPGPLAQSWSAWNCWQRSAGKLAGICSSGVISGSLELAASTPSTGCTAPSGEAEAAKARRCRLCTMATLSSCRRCCSRHAPGLADTAAGTRGTGRRQRQWSRSSSRTSLHSCAIWPTVCRRHAAVTMAASSPDAGAPPTSASSDQPVSSALASGDCTPHGMGEVLGGGVEGPLGDKGAASDIGWNNSHTAAITWSLLQLASSSARGAALLEKLLLRLGMRIRRSG
mmetsp:Transcript_6412/g.16619  ORF Transcript_6412/g.16619 Transcript_6412/m.16619 type:complete len:235 (+) Transcript_6412:764-1468(+)